jgi:hypothetical protein
MIPNLWANGLGLKELPPVPRGADYWRCDKLGCIATIGDKRIAFPQNGMALLEDCQRTQIIITPLRRVKCEQAHVIDGWNLYHGGTHAVWAKDLKVENSAEWQGNRPWSAR